MNALPATKIDPSLLKKINSAESLTDYFQGKIEDLSFEDIQALIELLNQSVLENQIQIENFQYIQHQYELAQRKYVDLFYFSPVGYLILDQFGAIIEANLTATNLLNYPNSCVVGKNIANFVVESEIPKLKEHHQSLFNGQRKGFCETIFRNKTLTEIPVQLESILWPDPDGNLTRIRTAVIDITEKRDLEAKLVQQAKQDALDSMVGSLAHDFNNILHSIISNTEYLAKDEYQSEVVNKRLDRILDLSTKAANSIAQLLDIGSQSNSHQRPLELNAFLQDHLDELCQLVPDIIALEWKKTSTPLWVNADPEQLKLVMINLLVNAVNAMTNGGSLIIELFKHDGLARRHKIADLSGAKWYGIKITDTGDGIDAEQMAHIFELEFSPRPRGDKRGYGLPQVHGIVRQHHGHVDIHTKVGVGTAVTIYLPTIAEKELNLPPSKPVKNLLNGGGRTILLVEDEIEVGESFREILEYLGFRVLIAINGNDGLKIYQGAKDEIELIITDLVMPEMDGESFLDELLKMNQTAKVIAISGYPIALRVNDLYKRGLVAFVQKPFTIQKISTVLGRVLEIEA